MRQRNTRSRTGISNRKRKNRRTLHYANLKRLPRKPASRAQRFTAPQDYADSAGRRSVGKHNPYPSETNPWTSRAAISRQAAEFEEARSMPQQQPGAIHNRLLNSLVCQTWIGSFDRQPLGIHGTLFERLQDPVFKYQ